jgi:PST family polysaccharide transporter
MRYLESRPHLVVYLKNIGWLFLDRGIRTIGGMALAVWIARYLGPSQFGDLSYATSFVTLFDSFATLGLGAVVLLELVRRPTEADSILGTAFRLQLAAGSISSLSAIAISQFLKPHNLTVTLTVVITSFVLALKVSETLRAQLQANQQSREIAIVESTSFISASAVRIAFLAFGASLPWFAFATLLESILVALGFAAAYTYQSPRNKFRSWSYNKREASDLLNNSWPMMLSGIANTINMKIDQVMLGLVLDSSAVGIYSAAARISEGWYFLPGLVMSVIFPSLAKKHAGTHVTEQQNWQRLYSLMVWLSIVIAAIFSLGSKWIVQVVYGPGYHEASGVLALHAWAGINVAVGTVWYRWILLERKQALALFSFLTAAISNVALNLLLMPRYGPVGAAVATIISYWLSALVGYSLHRPSITYGYLLRALDPRTIYR